MSQKNDDDWVSAFEQERRAFSQAKEEAARAAVVEEAIKALEVKATQGVSEPEILEPVIEEEEESAPVVEAAATPAHILVEPPRPDDESDLPALRTEKQIEQVVERMFERFNSFWDENPPRPTGQEKRTDETQQVVEHSSSAMMAPVAQPSATVIREEVNLGETKYELMEALRSELPRAMKGELVTLLRGEILTSVRKEVVRVIKDELTRSHTLLDKVTDRLASIETRLAKMEGHLGKEVAINFPKGAIKIEAPITVPEREVKIAAPVNVQPPAVHIDKGAIQVEFTKGDKGGKKKQVVFDRDPHDNSIKSAEIVDA